jgi:drug/metabolite transporter (DMT)-like permease
MLPWAQPLSVSGADMVRLVLFGTTQFGMGLLLLSLGTPLVSATRGALIGTLQTPLGTLWVWLAFTEIPAMATLLGGIVVLAAVIADIVIPRRKAEEANLSA